MTVTPISRCPWAPDHDPLYSAYHDTEWGVPEYDSRALWEKLVLDGMQAGLAWITILRKRETIREAFDGERDKGDLPEGGNLPDLESAAKAGQLGTLYLPVEHALLEEMHEQVDEHVKLREIDGESPETAENRTVLLALEHGADIQWYAAGAHDAVAEMRAELRS